MWTVHLLLALISASYSHGRGIDLLALDKETEENLNLTLFEGDIRLTDYQERELNQRNFIQYSSRLWDDAKYANGITYIIDPALGASQKAAIQEGITAYNKETCITFVEGSSAPGGSQQFLRFVDRGGCWSYIGEIPNNYFTDGQQVSIARGCTRLGTVLHEIGHALGMFHEQSRSDRDNNIEIIGENILSGRERNFRKESNTRNFNTPYDYYSMMHYDNRAFSSNGSPTLRSVASNPEGDILMGQRLNFSFYDKRIINLAYGCIADWEASCGSRTCQNDGYVNANCQCECPPNTEGNSCERRLGSYEDAIINDEAELESMKITQPTTIQTPGYPSGQRRKYVFNIVAPPCQTVVLRMNTFRLYQRLTMSDSTERCLIDSLEIRNDIRETVGSVYCGEEIAPGTEFRSEGSQMILYGNAYGLRNRGFTATVSFEGTPCNIGK